eukprot:scaffold65043_cov21-Tisochrysis_lutea.AAC.4
MFYIPSYKIYGAVAGFYDYGPPGCAIKQNMTQVGHTHAHEALHAYARRSLQDIYVLEHAHGVGQPHFKTSFKMWRAEGQQSRPSALEQRAIVQAFFMCACTYAA